MVIASFSSRLSARDKLLISGGKPRWDCVITNCKGRHDRDVVKQLKLTFSSYGHLHRAPSQAVGQALESLSVTVSKILRHS